VKQVVLGESVRGSDEAARIYVEADYNTFFFSRTSRRAARHYIKGEKRMIQFMRETGPKNHTHGTSLQRTPKHTKQEQALSNR
jgi:hypothetical protein